MGVGRCLIVALLGLWASVLAPQGVTAQPSYDCGRATTPTEIAICNSALLSALDVQMAETYRAARRGQSEALRSRILQEQRSWLRSREACRGDVGCIEIALRDRIVDLGGSAPVVAAPAPVPPAVTGAEGLSGLYCARGGDDALAVQVVGDNAEVSLSSWLANGHYCGTGPVILRRSGDGFVGRAQGCTIGVRQLGPLVAFSSGPAAACRAAFCGARGVMDTVNFTLADRRPLPAPVAGMRFAEVDYCR